ncbi:glycoside hydrolase [Termitidicoccus mucosus]|uniref:sialidase family protein n=1 Tax=Termitidicoccus mucosus TaxID=1184151 RepID=UPI002FEE4734
MLPIPTGRLRVCSCISALALLPSFFFQPIASAAVGQHVVYKSGTEGYHTFRIPSIVKAPNGDLLAFCEGRKNSRSDRGDIDILLRRSRDGGRTWGGIQVVWDDGENTCGNPCAVVDEKTGTIWLLLSHNIGTDREKEILAGTSAGTRTVWVSHSTDHGGSWSEPEEITAATKAADWGWYATGPGVGVQIKHGSHAERLVIPCDHSFPTKAAEDDPGAGYGSHAIYSDDHGKTWKFGAPIQPHVNECQLVELFDGKGTLLMDMRSYAKRSRRAQAASSDGGATWGPVRDADALVEPVCQASILRWERGEKKAGLLLFSNPAHPQKRVNLTVKASADNGKTWTLSRVLAKGPAAYSCLVAVDDDTAGCLYEGGESMAYERIIFARIPAADLLAR